MRQVEATDDSTMIGQAKNGDGDGDRRSKGRKVNTIGKATGFLVDERRWWQRLNHFVCVCTPLTSYWPIPHLHPISRLSFEYLLHVSLLPELFFILRRKEEVWGRTGRSGLVPRDDRSIWSTKAHNSLLRASKHPCKSNPIRNDPLATSCSPPRKPQKRGAAWASRHPGIQASWEFSKEPTWFFQVMSGLLALCVCAAGQPTSSRCSTLWAVLEVRSMFLRILISLILYRYIQFTRHFSI